MPYANPSPSSSPVATMTVTAASLPSPKSAPLPPPVVLASPRREEKRPVRHHQRSHSSEPIASTSSFIFVQQPSPEGPQRVGSPRSYVWGGAGAHDAPTQVQDAYATLPRQARRIRLSAMTPAKEGAAAGPRSPNSSSSSGGPSSQEESTSFADGLRGRKEGLSGADEDRTPRAGESLFSNAFPFGPSSSSPSPSPTPADDAMSAKPALMVRKKSGELVRPSLKADTMRRDFSKPRSAPATPVCPKYVHFDTQLEHVKHFLAQQRPAAVSRSGSPVETETEDEPEAFPFPAMATAAAGTVKLVLPNFPTRSLSAGRGLAATAAADADERDCYVESLEMTSDGKSIRGIVHVKNLAFEKWVAVRFTLDHWQTVSEVSAEHHESLPGGKADRFVFTIKLQDLLARIEEKTMYLAVRYTVGGREIWDNNDNQNYRIEFKRLPVPTARAVTAAAANAAASRAAAASAAERRKNAWSVTNAGQAADRMADLRRELDRLVREDNFDDDDEAGSAGVSGGGTGLGIGSRDGGANGGGGGGGAGGRGGGMRFADSRSYSEGAPSLSGRYDFGNSLKMYTDRGGNGSGGGMKEKVGAAASAPAGSPNLNVPLVVPQSSSSFFDPVSTSPQRPRAPPLPSNRRPGSPPKLYTTTLINGHPATVYDPSGLPIPQPHFINSHRLPGSGSPLQSPRSQLQPDFGLPSTSANYSGGQQQPASKAYFSPTSSTFPIPRSPPRSDPSASSYFYPAVNQSSTSNTSSPYLPLQDIPGQTNLVANVGGGNGGFNVGGGPRTRYASYPVGATGQSPRQPNSTMPYSPLVPPAFRDGRSRNSPFASPVPSPPMGMSPSASPPRVGSPSSGNGHVGSSLKLRSPPPERTSDTESDNDPPHLWSPATTDSAASTSSLASSTSSSSTSSVGTVKGGISPFLTSRLRRDGSEDSAASSLLGSPESDATSVPPDSPGFVGGLPLPQGDVKVLQRPSSALEFSNFLDRYRFHLNSNPSSLGGNGSSSEHSPSTSPLPVSSLGLSAPATFVSSPVQSAPADFFTFAAAAAASSPMPISGSTSPSSVATSVAGSPTPPARLSPLAQAAAVAASAPMATHPAPTFVS
ncbi:hypothetical protein JCM8097_005491 [Rhodosporidiobolus ruineniae]